MTPTDNSRAARLHHVWCMGVCDARAGRTSLPPSRDPYPPRPRSEIEAARKRYLEGYRAGQAMQPFPLTQKQREERGEARRGSSIGWPASADTAKAVAPEDPTGYHDEPRRLGDPGQDGSDGRDGRD